MTYMTETHNRANGTVTEQKLKNCGLGGSSRLGADRFKCLSLQSKHTKAQHPLAHINDITTHTRNRLTRAHLCCTCMKWQHASAFIRIIIFLLYRESKKSGE